ncbi:MAG: FmdB family zinc ribbon protein [Desulfatiglandales bacterium]
MPVYEYECTKCGHQMEVFQKISEAPIESCELCNGQIKKLISQSSFHLKGTGWYVTDYASRNKTSAPTKETAPEKKDAAPKSKAESGSKSTKQPSGTAVNKPKD